jgi:hypothetical protein
MSWKNSYKPNIHNAASSTADAVQYETVFLMHIVYPGTLVYSREVESLQTRSAAQASCSRSLSYKSYKNTSVQKKRPLIRRPSPCRSYRRLNLFTNWLISLQPLVMVPKYVMSPTSLHCCNQNMKH